MDVLQLLATVADLPRKMVGSAPYAKRKLVPYHKTASIRSRAKKGLIVVSDRNIRCGGSRLMVQAEQ